MQAVGVANGAAEGAKRALGGVVLFSYSNLRDTLEVCGVCVGGGVGGGGWGGGQGGVGGRGVVLARAWLAQRPAPCC